MSHPRMVTRILYLVHLFATAILGLVAVGGVSAADYSLEVATRSVLVAGPRDNSKLRSMDFEHAMAGARMGAATGNLRLVPDHLSENAVVKRSGSEGRAGSERARSSTEILSDAFIDHIVDIESGGRADAENTNSSALGPGQFIKSTWLQIVAKHRPHWAVGLDQRDILDKRKHPATARWAIRMYAEANIPVLQRAGVEASASALYLSHMLDGAVAAKLYRAAPNTPLKDIVGLAAYRANRTLMCGKKAKDLIAWAERKLGKRIAVGQRTG